MLVKTIKLSYQFAYYLISNNLLIKVGLKTNLIIFYLYIILLANSCNFILRRDHEYSSTTRVHCGPSGPDDKENTSMTKYTVCSGTGYVLYRQGARGKVHKRPCIYCNSNTKGESNEKEKAKTKKG